MGTEERITELEVKLRKEITTLQNQINTLNSQLQRLHGKVTHPSTLARQRAGIGPVKTQAGLLLVTTKYVEVMVDGIPEKVGLVG